MATPLKIEEMWAYISEDDHGEGIIGVMTSDGWMPMVGADEERMLSLRPEAELVAKTSKKNVILVKFSTREDLEVIEPNDKRNL